MRERQHAQHEREGRLRFVVVSNDGQDSSLISLIDLKNIFAKQLPKMPKEYIVRLVLDRHHTSLACVFDGEVVGGVTYRRHAAQAFAEVAFCAVSATHQVRGYGTRLMNQLKEHCKREGIHFLLTYADNHAIGKLASAGSERRPQSSGAARAERLCSAAVGSVSLTGSAR
jgi:histone acetyltransferase